MMILDCIVCEFAADADHNLYNAYVLFGLLLRVVA